MAKLVGPPCPKCGEAMRPLAKTPAGKTRWECRRPGEYCYSTTSPESSPRTERGDAQVRRRPVFKRRLDPDTKVYIITCAQNGTPVDPEFWPCLKTAARHKKAELLVVPIRYKNPTSLWEESQANEEYWVPEVQDYLWNQHTELNQNLVLIGDAKTQPTAAQPVVGYEAITGASSAIIGHPKIQMKCIPAPSNRMAKVLTTTGACTVPNYTDSKAGKIGAFHHSLAALVVEVVGKKFFLRHMGFDKKTGSCTDLDRRYYPDHHEKAPRAAALVMGDTHTDFISKDVERATFGSEGMVETLRPQELIWHDLLDAYAVNPHHKGNPFNAYAKVVSGRTSIADEVRRACHFVKDRTPKDTLSVIVPSNHNDFLRRWIVDSDWKTQPSNALFYLETAAQMLRETRFIPEIGTVYPSPFPMVFPQIVDCSNIKLLKDDHTDNKGPSHKVLGIELGMHGDRGPNGSRGSIQNHKRLGVRSIIGHSHCVGIEEGCYQVGTSTGLNLEYTGGPSSWLTAHCVINADGKRQMLIIVDGEWRARRGRLR